MHSIHEDSSFVTKFYNNLLLPRCLNPQNEWQACNIIFLISHENIFKIHFNPHLYTIKVNWFRMPNPHLYTALIIYNVLQLNEIITNKWQLMFPPVCPISLMLFKHLERCEALTQFGFHPCFQFIKHLWSMCCFLTNKVHIVETMSGMSILPCVVYMIITYLCHIRMKLQWLDGKFSNASIFF